MQKCLNSHFISFPFHVHSHQFYSLTRCDRRINSVHSNINLKLYVNYRYTTFTTLIQELKLIRMLISQSPKSQPNCYIPMWNNKQLPLSIYILLSAFTILNKHKMAFTILNKHKMAFTILNKHKMAFTSLNQFPKFQF